MSNVERLPRETADITNENVDKIAAMFPNCLTEAKDERGRVVRAIDFDKLRQELSHEIVEGPQERYQFNWPEKRKAMLLANTPTTMTLRPCREESVNFDTTQNLYIEGDNLDVLKLLRENYLGKVKMIYIDPPYNTGNDSFIYDDDFRKSVGDFSDESGERNDDGNKMFDLHQNNESNGRFHTDWLNMMYPRLKIAKDLLSEDGVIFISIDDGEVENLRKVCDEVFGERNFVVQFVWQKKSSGGQHANNVLDFHEYIICFSKSIDSMPALSVERSETQLESFTLSDEHESERGKHLLSPLKSWLDYRKTLIYDIECPDGSVVNTQWVCAKATFEKLKAEDRIVFKKSKKGEWSIYKKQYANENEGRVKPASLIIDHGQTANGKREIKELFGADVISFPKPLELMAYLISSSNDKHSLVLDFFSGSATTAHAVMKLNAEDGGNRKFIMVQLPEPCDEKSEAAKAGYKNICEIGKERIRRAGKKIMEEFLATKNSSGRRSDGAEDLFPPASPVLCGSETPPDIGFRVLKLDSSNMEDVLMSPAKFAKEAMQGTLDLGFGTSSSQMTMDFESKPSLASNIKPGRTAEDLLFQAMLRLDVPLSAKIQTEEIHGKKVFSVMGGHLLATFDTDVNEEAITAIAKRKPGIFVMCDGGYATDNVADNFEQIWREYSPETVRRVV